MTLQTITLHLDGVTAGDYLAWVRDPEPAPSALRSIALDADPLADRVVATLAWADAAPAPHVAAAAAGLPVTADVKAVTAASHGPMRVLDARLAA